jgi:hypothetical protein
MLSHFRLFLKTQTAIINATLVRFSAKDNDPLLNVRIEEMNIEYHGWLALATSESDWCEGDFQRMRSRLSGEKKLNRFFRKVMLALKEKR